jgi:hypothetical protein
VIGFIQKKGYKNMLLDNSCVIPLLQINKEDCVGDSVGKHNYNLMALDTTICNLSSLLYEDKSNYSSLNSTLTGLELMINAYSQYYDLINENLYNEFKKATTVVNLLSSYWGNYEFSVQVPINSISLSANDLPLFAMSLSSINLENINNVVEKFLKNLTKSYLDINYSPKNYSNFTVVNASFFLYNLIPVINNNNTTDPLIKIKYLPQNNFSFNQRLVTVTYNRDNVHFTSGVVLRFIVDNGNWKFIGYYLDDSINTAEPNYNNQVIRQLPEEDTITADESKTIYGPCEPINVNTWYVNAQSSYANALYTGTSNNLGSITLMMKTKNNQIEKITHKASGYNPNTKTGGTDVFLELNGNVINAYEQNPIKKTLVKSWINPFFETIGTVFKFTVDGKGISFSACSSSSFI